MKKKPFWIILIWSALTCTYLGATPGHWEVGFHYSYWNVDMIAPILEDMTPELAYYDVDKGSLDFDSHGNNMGFELRFFPGGKKGAFSISISYERNNFKASMYGAYTDTDFYGYKSDAEVVGNIEILPHSFNLGLRWDIWPEARVHPFIGFGFGIGALKGTAGYNSKQIIYTGKNTYTLEMEEDWTLKELIEQYEEENGKKFPLSFVPIIHLQFGFRGEIIYNIFLQAEISFYDGLLFRGGIGYRF